MAERSPFARIKGLTMELDPKYCDVIVKRWCEFTGKDATLESDGTKFDRKGEGFSPLLADGS